MKFNGFDLQRKIYHGCLAITVMKTFSSTSKNLLPSLIAAGTLLLSGAGTKAAEVATVPEGYVTINIAAGTGTNKVITPISLPLLDASQAAGQLTGRITGVTASSISNSNAAWTAGQLSVAATPHLIRITSGLATGYTFLISTSTANTASTLTIDSVDAGQVNLLALGIVTGANGDTYQIVPCDTLSSFFGTPATTGILGGASATTADSIVLNNNGTLMTYYYSTATSPNRWTRSTVGSPDASNTPIRPDAGVYYSRLANTPLVLSLVGQVPSTDRKAIVRNSGLTYLAQGWPVDITLGNLGINNTPNWTSDANVANADTVQIMISGGYRTYWYDGTNWRRQTVGTPISNSQIIPAGTSIILNQKGTATGTSVLSQTKSYSLE